MSDLFRPLTPDAAKLLKDFGPLLNKVAPLKGKHRAKLAYGIRDLSRNLTGERGGLSSDYMGDPYFASAYLRYFLPWNMYRFSRLLPSLDLDLYDGSRIADLGAGPLTFLLSLWISRPDLREKKLNFLCLDRTPKPMRTGLELFESLAGNAGSRWRVTLVKGGATHRLKDRVDLLVAANTLNELALSDRHFFEEGVGRVSRVLSKNLRDKGRLLILEPGTRQSGHVITALRRELMHAGLMPVAPCPHLEGCPMDAPQTGQWCHFNYDVDKAPAWLQKVSKEAALPKSNVSLSFLFAAPQVEHKDGAVRAISRPFDIPTGMGQYGCTAEGLVLLQGRHLPEMPFPGALLRPKRPEVPQIDEKSGAAIIPLGKLADRAPLRADEQPVLREPRPAPEDAEQLKTDTGRHDGKTDRKKDSGPKGHGQDAAPGERPGPGKDGRPTRRKRGSRGRGKTDRDASGNAQGSKPKRDDRSGDGGKPRGGKGSSKGRKPSRPKKPRGGKGE